MGEYPSAAALIEMNKSEAYAVAHQHRSAALAETAMYAIPAGWGGAESHNARKPNPTVKAPPCNKTDKQLEAINGNPEGFLAFVSDNRFERDTKSPSAILMLNFLRYEPGEGKALYEEYGARANSHITGMDKNKDGKGGGLALVKNAVHTLRGPDFDTIAIMRYPSRSAFLSYAMGQGKGGSSASKGNELVAEGFKLRQAGLAVQGLVGMLPENIYDPAGQSRL